MRAVIFFGLLCLSSAFAFEQIVKDYHAEIGIPLAEKIRVYEESLSEDQKQDDRIIGGAVAPVGSHPYFAGLLISLIGVAGNSVCGSTLLTTNRLVTAAHCWRHGSNQASQFTVILGTKRLYDGGVRIATRQVIMHPQWTEATLRNDVAMIYLPQHVTFTTLIRPIALPIGAELWQTFVGQWAVAAGYGKISDSQSGASQQVSHVVLQVISVAQCQATYGPGPVTESTLCTSGAGGVGICGGDSGGPLALNFNGRPILIGISSFAAQNQCQRGFPSGFARATSFVSFIGQHFYIRDGCSAIIVCDKMRAIFLLGVLLVASASAFKEVLQNYHEEIGIPLAEKIRVYEESLKTAEQDDRIVGGALAPVGAHPYFAGLLISLIGVSGNSVCGATLLSANRLVTAAHCWRLRTNQAWQFTVILGSNFLFSGGIRIATSQVIMHPQWDETNLNNDVAMIYLPTNVAFSTTIQPVDLPNTSELWETFVGQWAVAAGFGRTSDLQTGASTVVSHVALQVITNAQCRVLYGNFVNDSTLCTNGAGGVGVCGGDSGGPLVLTHNGRTVLIGISSFAASNGCQLGFPSGFARTTVVRSFIVQHL
ncbi:transmembrane protease serine 9-like [Anticarsia gemmatalis]|uniref:transmembrane protease serine 9-like n=1 Tax=Anticarsia gemmatalis TaxID=129554 RepID=UPI003F769650